MHTGTPARLSCMIMKSRRCRGSQPGATHHHHHPAQFLKLNASTMLFAFILIFGFSDVLRSVKSTEYTEYNVEITEEALQDTSYNPKFAEVYRKKTHLPKDIKYVLFWTQNDYFPFYNLGEGQRKFIKNNCLMINCYITSDREFFNGDLTKFDAIAFNGRNIQNYTKNDFPSVRAPQQKYIYFNTESAENFRVRNDVFNNMFNWTATYRLDSDILYNYFIIKDYNRTIVGPKENMKWAENMGKIKKDLAERLRNKTKAAAWFVSNCATRSKREQFVSKLQKAMKLLHLSLDIYGSCGPFKCPRYRQSDCDKALEKDYFFYMSLENSFAEDYVTEKLLTALQHDTVPIVLGGANYSRFLPPGSYLNGLKYSPIQLAALMDRLIRSPRTYQKYFKWKNHYTYEMATQQNVYNLCAALNDVTFETSSVYGDFRDWWNPRMKHRYWYFT